MSGSTTKKREAFWAIRSVSLEARNVATAAARREGLTLSEWLDRSIRQLAECSVAPPSGRAKKQKLLDKDG